MRPRASNMSKLRASEDAFEALECSDVFTDVVTDEPGRRFPSPFWRVGFVVRSGVSYEQRLRGSRQAMARATSGYYEHRKEAWLSDRQTRDHYERERREIEQIDAVIRSLDQLRVDADISKTEFARRIGRNPSSIRRLFTAQTARPELPLIVSIADELGARIEITAGPAARVAPARKRVSA